MFRIAQVVGLPFLFIPSSTMAFSTIPPEKSSKASALYSLMRNLGGSFGISILLSYVTRHQQQHQNYMVEHLLPTERGYNHTLAQSSHTILSAGHPHAVQEALGHIYQQLLNQSSILAYADVFQFVALITFALSFVALLMPRVDMSRKPAPVEAH
jgi:DHA2 family multidrug resistance protein